jgi:acetolactate synthase-1/2/3 large subunit
MVPTIKEAPMKASELFLRCLEAEGVEYVFGVPGEENADVMLSLRDSPIRFVATHHEQGAAFMADLYGRMTGRPGVCLATLGPGAANLVTGIANANMDRSPVIALTGQAATTRLHKESHQAMDVVGMFGPITKWATSVREACTIPEVVRKAFKLAVAEKPGAVHVELPEDIAKHEAAQAPIRPPSSPAHPLPDTAALAAALELLAAAEHPVLLVGNGCVRESVSAQLTRFVDTTGIYAAMTFMAKGALSDRHPRSLYAAGLGSRDHVTEVFEAADLVVTLGYDMVEWHPARWNTGRPKRIVHIDSAPAEVDDAYQVAIEIVGDLAAAICALADGVDPGRRRDTPAHARVRETLTGEISEQYAADDAYPVKPQRILVDLRSAMADEDVLISDVGAHKMWVARHYPAYRPNTVIISNGFCSMGVALPGALATKLVHPDRRVVALCGDAGFLMNVQELATAVRLKLAPLVLVWEDGAFGLIEWKQEAEFGRHFGTEFGTVDVAGIAAGFGCHARRVGSAAELAPALKEAFAVTDRPSVVVVPVDYGENLKLTRRLGELLPR